MNFLKMREILLVERNPTSYKGDYGRSLIIGGSLSYPNAPYLASLGAIYGGSGYVALSIPKEIYIPLVSKSHPMTTFEPYELEEIHLEKYDAILYGSGISETLKETKHLQYLLKNYQGYLLLDGGALNLLAKDPSLLLEHKAKEIVLTPHLGEARRLLNLSKDVELVPSLVNYAKSNKVAIFLKGHPSIYIDKDGELIKSEDYQTPLLARAGTGDIFAGIVCSLLSYGTKQYSVKELVLFADYLLHVEAQSFSKNHLQIGSYSAADLFLKK